MIEPMFKNFVTELRLRGYSEETIRAYLYYNRKFHNFTNKEPRSVTRQDIKSYMNKLLLDRLKERSRNSAHNALKSYYDDYLKKRLFNDIKRAKIPNDMPNILSKDEIESMIDYTKNIKHKLLIELLYSSGMRITECLKVKVNDIDIQKRMIFIKNGKGKKDRYVITSKRFIEDLSYYLKTRKRDSEYIFENKSGHLTQRTAQKVLKESAYKAGIPKRVYPHMMRASFATHCIEDDVPIGRLQKQLGHARITTTQGYVRYRTDDITKIRSPLDH